MVLAPATLSPRTIQALEARRNGEAEGEDSALQGGKLRRRAVKRTRRGRRVPEQTVGDVTGHVRGLEEGRERVPQRVSVEGHLVA
jgi:hypothetical protein